MQQKAKKQYYAFLITNQIEEWGYAGSTVIIVQGMFLDLENLIALLQGSTCATTVRKNVKPTRVI